MRGFEFQFDSVLKYRKLIEDQHQRDLAKLLRHRMILQDQLTQMQRTITQSKQDLAGGLVGEVDMRAVGGFARYSGQVAQQAQIIAVQMARVQEQVAAAREQLLKATRDRQALELLRDRQYERWRRDQDRRQTAALDELAVQRYSRPVLTE